MCCAEGRDAFRALFRVVALSLVLAGGRAPAQALIILAFAVLSDAQFKLTDALGLPTFMVDGMRLIKRLTLIARRAAVEAVLYPIREPERSAADVIAWLDANSHDPSGAVE